jgi:hypothetical protein
VKIRSLLSLVLDSILSNRLFKSNRLFRDSKRVLIRDSKKILISSSIKKLRDLNTKLD